MVLILDLLNLRYHLEIYKEEFNRKLKVSRAWKDAQARKKQECKTTYGHISHGELGGGMNEKLHIALGWVIQ